LPVSLACVNLNESEISKGH